MSNIDKQWLQQKIADMEAARDEIPFGLDEGDSNTLAALRIALASLEAEPVGTFRNGPCGYSPSFHEDAVPLYTATPAPVSVPDEREAFNAWNNDTDYPLAGRNAKTAAWLAWSRRAAMLQGAETELQRKAAIHDALCEKYNVESLADFVEWQRNHIAELEAAPPAPVGTDETAVMPDYPGYVMTQRECYQAGKKAGMAEDGSAPVAHDGWVACSERMPETDGNYWGWWSESKRQGPVWFIKSELQAQFQSSEITHWMPLPAAPQQEVK